MQGGMVWDTEQQAAIATNIEWIATHSNVTNELGPDDLVEQIRTLS